MGDEAHQPPGLEPIEAIAEEVWSMRADPSAATPSASAPKVSTTSAQQVKDDDVVPDTRTGT